MAESLGDKLKRIAAEKKAARELAEKQASAAGGATPAIGSAEFRELVTENSEANLEARFKLAAEKIANESKSGDELLLAGVGSDASNLDVMGTAEDSESSESSKSTAEEAGLTTETNSAEVRGNVLGGSVSVGTVNVSNGDSGSSVCSEAIAVRSTSEHPLSMQFAEMEQALLAADPTFKTILRDVHRQLGNDPELVTMMTEDEIQLVVRGLIVHAKAEIIEPAKAKTVKKAVAEAKKKAISADDL